MTTFRGELAQPYDIDWTNPDTDELLTCQIDDGITVTNVITGATGETFDAANQIGATDGTYRVGATWTTKPVGIDSDPYSLFKTIEDVNQEYALALNGTDQWVSFDPITITGDYSVKRKVLMKDFLNRTLFGSDTGQVTWRFNNSTQMRIKTESTNAIVIDLNSALVVDTWYEIEIKRTGLTYEVWVDGVLFGTNTVGSANTFIINRIGQKGDIHFFSGSDSTIQITDFVDSSNSRYWEFNQTKGDTVTDHINGAVAALVNFSADSGYVRSYAPDESKTKTLSGQTFTDYNQVPFGVIASSGRTVDIEFTAHTNGLLRFLGRNSNYGNFQLEDGKISILTGAGTQTTSTATLYGVGERVKLRLELVENTAEVKIYKNLTLIDTLFVAYPSSMDRVGARFSIDGNLTLHVLDIYESNGSLARSLDFKTDYGISGQYKDLVTNITYNAKNTSLTYFYYDYYGYGEVGGYLFNGTTTATLPLVGAYTGTITFIDSTTLAISGSDNYIVDSGHKIAVKSIEVTDTVSTFFYDFTTGDSDQIIETINGNHADITNSSTVKWQPVLPVDISTVGSGVKWDYQLIKTFLDAVKNNANTQRAVIYDSDSGTDAIYTNGSCPRIEFHAAKGLEYNCKGLPAVNFMARRMYSYNSYYSLKNIGMNIYNGSGFDATNCYVQVDVHSGYGSGTWSIKNSLVHSLFDNVATNRQTHIIDSIFEKGRTSTVGSTAANNLELYIQNCVVPSTAKINSENIGAYAAAGTKTYTSNTLFEDANKVSIYTDSGGNEDSVDMSTWFTDTALKDYSITQAGETALAGKGWNGTDIAGWAYVDTVVIGTIVFSPANSVSTTSPFDINLNVSISLTSGESISAANEFTLALVNGITITSAESLSTVDSFSFSITSALGLTPASTTTSSSPFDMTLLSTISYNGAGSTVSFGTFSLVIGSTIGFAGAESLSSSGTFSIDGGLVLRLDFTGAESTTSSDSFNMTLSNSFEFSSAESDSSFSGYAVAAVGNMFFTPASSKSSSTLFNLELEALVSLVGATSASSFGAFLVLEESEYVGIRSYGLTYSPVEANIRSNGLTYPPVEANISLQIQGYGITLIDK